MAQQFSFGLNRHHPAQRTVHVGHSVLVIGLNKLRQGTWLRAVGPISRLGRVDDSTTLEVATFTTIERDRLFDAIWINNQRFTTRTQEGLNRDTPLIFGDIHQLTDWCGLDAILIQQLH